MPASFPGRSGRHPQRLEMFKTLADRFPASSGGMKAALNALCDGYQIFTTQTARIENDQLSTEGVRLVRRAKAARAILPLIEKLDAVNEAANEQAAQLEATIAGSYKPEAPPYWSVLREQEIRGYLRSLNNSERLQLLETARASGDRDILVAIANAPAFLSGMPAQLQQLARDELIAAHAPQEAETLKALREQQSHARQFRDEMLQSVADTPGIDLIKADELVEAARDDVAAA